MKFYYPVISTYKKVDVARAQLDTALRLFFDGGHRDRFAVITLAGAAEELLGRLLELQGQTPSVKSDAKTQAEMHELIFKEPLQPKHFLMRANMARNSIKHLDSQSDLEVTFDPDDEAEAILLRATDNYFALGLPDSDFVNKFVSWYLEKTAGR